jgi:hypothetical protein
MKISVSADHLFIRIVSRSAAMRTV